MAKIIQKKSIIIVENMCPPKFKRELTLLIKEIMKSYNVRNKDEETNKVFVSILNSNVCVLVDNHFCEDKYEEDKQSD